jgi:hypothetical protein
LILTKGGSEEKDTAGKILVPKGVMPPDIPRSPKVGVTTEVVTPSAIVMTEEKIDSSKPVPMDDKGKGPPKIEEAKRAIEDDTPLGVGPFDQELGTQRYTIHHAARMVMGAKQLAGAIGYAK